MNEVIVVDNNERNELFDDIKDLIEQSKNKVYKAVNNEIVNLHWNIGRIIIEKQKGHEKPNMVIT